MNYSEEITLFERDNSESRFFCLARVHERNVSVELDHGVLETREEIEVHIRTITPLEGNYNNGRVIWNNKNYEITTIERSKFSQETKITALETKDGT